MHAWDDDRIRRVMGSFLRWGVVVAAATAVAGGILYFRSCGGAIPDYRVFRGEPPELRAVALIAREAISLNPLGLIQFGLLLLIATPLASIAFSLAVFLLQRDYAYIAVSLVVLSVVLFGLTREGAPAAPSENFRMMCTASDTSLRFLNMMEVPGRNSR